MIKEEILDRKWCEVNNVSIEYGDLTKEQAMAVTKEVEPSVFKIIISDQIPADNIAPLLRHEITHIHTNETAAQWFYAIQGKQIWINNMYMQEVRCYKEEFYLLKKLIRNKIELCPALYEKYLELKKGIPQYIDRSPVFGVGYISAWNTSYDEMVSKYSFEGKLIIHKSLYDKMKYYYSRGLRRLRDKYVVV